MPVLKFETFILATFANARIVKVIIKGVATL